MGKSHPGIEEAGMAVLPQSLLMRLPNDAVLRERMALVGLPLDLAQGIQATGLEVTDARREFPRVTLSLSYRALT